MPAQRPAQTKHVPGAAAGAGRGARLRQIVSIALERRRMLVARGLCRVPDGHMAISRMRLEVWLDRNPWPSDATVRRFDLAADVHLVMPENNEGRKLMDELRALLTT